MLDFMGNRLDGKSSEQYVITRYPNFSESDNPLYDQNSIFEFLKPEFYEYKEFYYKSEDRSAKTMFIDRNHTNAFYTDESNFFSFFEDNDDISGYSNVIRNGVVIEDEIEDVKYRAYRTFNIEEVERNSESGEKLITKYDYGLLLDKTNETIEAKTDTYSKILYLENSNYIRVELYDLQTGVKRTLEYDNGELIGAPKIVNLSEDSFNEIKQEANYFINSKIEEYIYQAKIKGVEVDEKIFDRFRDASNPDKFIIGNTLNNEITEVKTKKKAT